MHYKLTHSAHVHTVNKPHAMLGIKKASDQNKIYIILSFQVPTGGEEAWSQWYVRPAHKHLSTWEEEGKRGGSWWADVFTLRC